MKPLYSVAQIRATEQAACAGLAPGTLMQRAGKAAADAAIELMHDGAVLVLAGPGNNGGDALEAAANLADAGLDVAIVHLAGSGASAPETAAALARARASDARFIDVAPLRRDWALVLDGLFGIGLARPLAGAARVLAETVNGFACPVLALDTPSGLDADTGAIVGPDGCAVRATHTITFIGDKPGLHTLDGRDCAGTVLVATLAIDPALLPPPHARLNQVALFAQQLKPRRHNSHKGSFGDVAIVGGAAGMAGAPMLAARAALFAGAGRVFVASLAGATGYDSHTPEIMLRNAEQFDGARSTLVLGPGMGDSDLAIRMLQKALDSAAPLVLDADALNLIAASADLQQRLCQRAAPSILTPHPLEAARLLASDAGAVQADRLASARTLAQLFQASVVLKGCGSVIANADGAITLNPTGNPGLATAGTGDVLAGLCGSLLAQGWPETKAAQGAVWIHGAAADRLLAQGVGPIGMTAGELPDAIRAELNALVASGHAAGSD